MSAQPGWIAALVLTLASCAKPPPAVVVTLHGDSPDGSTVQHNIIAVRSPERRLILNMEVLTPAEFVDYRATLSRGSEKILSKDHLLLENESIRLDLEPDQVPSGDYTIVVEARDDKGKMYPFATYKFQTVR